MRPDKHVPLQPTKPWSRSEDAPKPIDWTRPLRVVHSHASALVVGIYPDHAFPVRVRIDGLPPACWYSRDGKPGEDAHEGCGPLENVPAKPRIVERFGLATPLPSGNDAYRMAEIAYPTRAEAVAVRNLIADNGRCRIARVIIEELADE